MINTRYLIIGNSAGGIGAAEAIREVDKAGSLLVISDEPYPAYSRPMISEHLAQGCPLEKMLYRPGDFYQRLDIQPVSTRRSISLSWTTASRLPGRSCCWLPAACPSFPR